MADEGRKAKRIAVISGKGGVGKTVITANLAAALASIGRRILVVDADLGLANLDVILGVAPQFTIHDLLQRTRSLEEVLVPTTQGFDLLPAGSGLPEGAAFSPALAKDIDSILSSLEHRYDTIFFDTGAGVGDVVLLFANLAHEILLVVTPEPTSIMDAYATIKILNQVYERSKFLLIVNQANADHSGQVGAKVANHLQSVISKFLDDDHQNPVRLELICSIPEDPAIPQAIRQRQLLAEISPLAPSACLMNSLAGLLDTHVH
jgi:flagellar biosynthesis protein FlhG